MFQALCTFVYISLLSGVGERLAVKLRCELFESIMRQDLEFFDQKHTGELVDCLTTDVQEFKSSFKQCISQGLRSLTQITGSVISLFIISPRMTCAMLIVVPSVIVVGTMLGSLLRSLSQRAQVQAVKAITISEEVISNIRTVRAFANEEKECLKFKEELEKASNLNISLGYGIGLFQAGTNLFLNGLVLGTLFLGGRLMITDNLSPGNLMSFLVATQTIQRSLAQLSLLFGHFIKGKQAAARVFEFIGLSPSIPLSGGGKVDFSTSIPNVEFKNVTFAYPSRPSQVILKNLNLSLPAGKTVAIVGSSGNGKSTIAALLERFYDINEGCITISGLDIRSLDPSWLRRYAIGMISQEPVLFATTIKENIRYGNPDATDKEVYDAAMLANAHDFISSFPNGYNTLLGERGVTISGGQKQRIAIARALIKNPAILILDEATSALDAESEKIVQKTLEQVCKGRTVLVIAHRLSTIQDADIIVVLNKGIIVEVGNHQSLCKKKGAYYSLMNQQNQEKPRQQA
ncbi:hypothetical protein AAG570_012804 [Ranatra chinensis]|uniref:Mitochondrial potassium channel ATP-binding subunit n=1 Tax=Ranatra chinensis TaxID=642074 RepID=A0ABD0YEX4_9HEMI